MEARKKKKRKKKEPGEGKTRKPLSGLWESETNKFLMFGFFLCFFVTFFWLLFF